MKQQTTKNSDNYTMRTAYTIVNAQSHFSASDLVAFRCENDPQFAKIPETIAQKMICNQLDRGDIFVATEGNRILGTGQICKIKERQQSHRTKSLFDDISEIIHSLHMEDSSTNLAHDELTLRLLVKKYTGKSIASDVSIRIFTDSQFANRRYHPNDSDAFLSNLSVAKSHRSQGIGTALVKFRIDVSRHNDATAAYVSTVSGPSKQIYDKLGFEPLLYVSSWFDFPVTHMGKLLTH